jgi:hypothetical protein
MSFRGKILLFRDTVYVAKQSPALPNCLAGVQRNNLSKRPESISSGPWPFAADFERVMGTWSVVTWKLSSIANFTWKYW